MTIGSDRCIDDRVWAHRQDRDAGKRRDRSSVAWNGLAAILSLLAATQASAVADIQSTSGNSDRRQIEEIVVTAERKESTVSDTSISITAFTGAMLEDFGIRNQEDLQRTGISLFSSRACSASSRTHSEPSEWGDHSTTTKRAALSSRSISLANFAPPRMCRSHQTEKPADKRPLAIFSAIARSSLT
jgi:hypothetical protein